MVPEGWRGLEGQGSGVRSYLLGCEDSCTSKDLRAGTGMGTGTGTGTGWIQEQESSRLTRMPHFRFKEALGRNRLLSSRPPSVFPPLPCPVPSCPGRAAGPQHLPDEGFSGAAPPASRQHPRPPGLRGAEVPGLRREPLPGARELREGREPVHRAGGEGSVLTPDPRNHVQQNQVVPVSFASGQRPGSRDLQAPEQHRRTPEPHGQHARTLRPLLQRPGQADSLRPLRHPEEEADGAGPSPAAQLVGRPQRRSPGQVRHLQDHEPQPPTAPGKDVLGCGRPGLLRAGEHRPKLLQPPAHRKERILHRSSFRLLRQAGGATLPPAFYGQHGNGLRHPAPSGWSDSAPPPLPKESESRNWIGPAAHRGSQD
ncbi:lymphocyte expansion molecule isoform X3 [Ornithorhynchus anatinus]|uniref:lymphocyte expansion molecule isoform X3 n=1 Tax=Ornithorhynchus anatinus TaxID=9258 RepID=UPI0010A8BA57|nr:lymphocyte expansion molecule isoform X3 [Ornithorhynchus anatinus]